MDREERNNLFYKFLQNGMNISDFRFRDENDKKNLFLVYEEYLKSMMGSERKIHIYKNIDSDISVYMDGREVCMFEITPDFQTLQCHTALTLEDDDLVYCLSMFFLTIKELKSMMSILSKGFDKISKQKDHKSSGKYYGLPKGTRDVINKIENLQESIMKNIDINNKKYKIKKGDKSWKKD